MIEIPRAALIADEIAKEAEFFSFGTNDLTQMTFGYTRDDFGKFLLVYLSQGTLQHDPFKVIDQKGVGRLVRMATEKGRAVNPNLKSDLKIRESFIDFKDFQTDLACLRVKLQTDWNRKRHRCYLLRFESIISSDAFTHMKKLGFSEWSYQEHA
ncbi:hypothetical protein L1987_13561 [Smallanthus sonchifolius]|uniref:Uncharacterized protein n=1 Tax=Smallanthus sonchifolius TaxID=185202 RepID=A0ACB9JGT4_9ASTR|nr:hypothetical protein L1987_13561 [Smallanthus sonchifolius]